MRDVSIYHAMIAFLPHRSHLFAQNTAVTINLNFSTIILLNTAGSGYYKGNAMCGFNALDGAEGG